MKKLILDTNQIIEFYNSGLSAMTISKQLKCSEGVIQKRLKEASIKSRSLKECHPIKADHTYFKEIDTEEKAYWLGFIYADGNVGIRKQYRNNIIYYQYVISLAQAEKEVIEKFKKAIKSTHKITEYEYKRPSVIYTLSITSQKMFEDLNRHGVVPNKSLVLKPPTTVPSNLISHFIRGYFDGDGSICKSVSTRKYSTWVAKTTLGSVHICGTYEFLSWLKKQLIFLTIKNNIRKEKRRISNTWFLTFNGNKQIDAFYQYLYNASTIYLTRKKLKFEECFKERGSTTIIGNPIRGPYKNSNWIKV